MRRIIRLYNTDAARAAIRTKPKTIFANRKATGGARWTLFLALKYEILLPEAALFLGFVSLFDQLQ